ncbi:MAG: VCBS repeat-containing protein [Bacteroidia bacterium]|nr:VCBS repeat-containing protein [Bacteroidia bacterium]
MNFTTARIDTILATSVSTAAAADFDNDGDIDILVHSKGDILFENTGNLTFNRRKLNLTSPLFMASVSAIDLDRDSDVDYIIAGKESGGFGGSGCHTYVYENTGNLTFSLLQSIAPAIGSTTFTIDAGATATNPADITWNDFNFDGYPDLLLTGEDEYLNSLNQIFLNDGTGQLVSTSLSPRPADRYSSTWIDFNTDGFLDIIIPRIGYTVDNSIYFNNENTGFNGFSTVIDNIPFPAFLKALDVDNDKDKDILVTNKIDLTVGFRTETVIYTNNNNKVNSAPNSPTTTSSQIDVFDVILNWNNGWDKLTLNNGLTYNIWVGTANNKADIVSPMADLTTGYRYVEALGNVGTNTSWRLKNLPLGTYYWSVQTIDNSLTPSAWAPVKSFTLSALTANFTNDEVCLGLDTHLSDNSVTTHPITSWKWVIGGKTVSTAQNPVFRFSRSGNNSVMLIVESSVATDTIIKNVYVKPVPDAAFINNTVCAGTSTLFTNTTATNGLTMNEWHWDFGDNSGSNVQNPGTHGYLVAGTYYTILVAVADNGCSDTIRKAVDVGVIPTAAITLTGLPNFCSDDSVKLVNSYTDTYTYSWQNEGADITGAVTNTYTARQSGSYTVKVTNPVGNCTSVSPVVNITVKDAPLRPAIAYTGDTVFCAGENLLLSAPFDNDLTYKWKLNGGSVGKDTSIHAAEIGGEYTLVVTNSKGCSSLSVNKVEIKVNSRPAAATLSPPSKPQICQGEDIVLGVTAFPAYSYQWLNESTPVTGAVSNTLRVTATGKYQLEISNASGCSIRTNIVDIVVNASPVKPIIDTSNYDKNMCIGEKPLKISIFNPIENYNYTWYKNGAPTGTMTYIEDFLEDGTYYVEADLNGCKSNSEVITLDFKEAMPKPVIDVKGPVVWYLTTNSKAEHYKWYYNGSQISDALSSTYIAGQKLGIYRVSISNDGVCYRISDAVTIPASPGLTGIEDSDPFEGVKIYPNPTTGIFTIELNNNVFGELVIDIITQNGSKILNIRFDKSTEHFMSQIDLSGQPSGMYLVNLAIDKFKAVRKVLVE